MKEVTLFATWKAQKKIHAIEKRKEISSRKRKNFKREGETEIEKGKGRDRNWERERESRRESAGGWLTCLEIPFFCSGPFPKKRWHLRWSIFFFLPFFFHFFSFFILSFFSSFYFLFLSLLLLVSIFLALFFHWIFARPFARIDLSHKTLSFHIQETEERIKGRKKKWKRKKE